MEKVISDLKKTGQKPKLLLHACCAPCSSSCIERLKEYFDLTVYFYNPNMDSREEYSLRASEQKKLCEWFAVPLILEDYLSEDFLSIAHGLENEKEGGARCKKCFSLRLKKCADYAKANGFEYFTTSLTVSPLKDVERLNVIGKSVGESVGVKFLPSDFKKKNGYARSIELSRELKLYRQNYCGCVYSKTLSPQ